MLAHFNTIPDVEKILEKQNLQGLTLDENHRIVSLSDSRNIRIWESASLIELYSKYSSFSEVLFLQTETKVSPGSGPEKRSRALLF